MFRIRTSLVRICDILERIRDILERIRDILERIRDILERIRIWIRMDPHESAPCLEVGSGSASN